MVATEHLFYNYTLCWWQYLTSWVADLLPLESVQDSWSCEWKQNEYLLLLDVSQGKARSCKLSEAESHCLQAVLKLQNQKGFAEKL